MREYSGKSVYGGIAIGPIKVIKKDNSQVKRIHITDTESEVNRFVQAKQNSKEQLEKLYKKAVLEVGEANAAIFDIHNMMLDDLDYIESIENVIRTQSVNAEYAVALTGDNFSEMFSAMDDDYMKARASDVKDISERIRLFYVALTRAKEKMIMVIPNNMEDISFKEDLNSFLTFISLVKFVLKDNIKYINNVPLTKNYNFQKEKDLFEKNNDLLNVEEIKVDSNLITHSNVSKKVLKLLTKEEVNAMEYGTHIHEIFETEDLRNTNNKYVLALLEKIDNNFKNVYKEYEFIYKYEDKEYDGIIDLLLEYEDKMVIIDYKLSNIDDENYVKQLSIYKSFIENKTKKEIRSHHDYININDFIDFLNRIKHLNIDLDIMLEAKAKDEALFKLVRLLKYHDYKFVDDTTFLIEK